MKMRQHQCFLHAERGAVARCPECRRFYCHECITEHEGEVLCRSCLSRAVEDDDAASGFMDRHGAFVRLLVKPLLALAGVILLWFLFVSLGSMLMHFPDSFYISASDNSGEKGSSLK